jgi:hypothetical protein
MRPANQLTETGVVRRHEKVGRSYLGGSFVKDVMAWYNSCTSRVAWDYKH